MGFVIDSLSSKAMIGTQPTAVHFNNVHNKLSMKFEKNYKNYDKMADKATKILNDIKNLQGNYAGLQEEITKFLGFKDKNGGIGTLFHRRGSNSAETGWYFEREIAALRQILINKALERLGEKITVPTGHQMNGEQRINVNLDFETGRVTATPTNRGKRLEDILEGDILKQEYLEAVMAISRLTLDPKISNLIVYQAKQTKSDMHGGKGTAGFDLRWDTGKDLEWLGKFLSSYNFSLKNYSDLRQVHLGETNPYRAYFSVLSKLGYGQNIIHNSYLRAFCCYINSVKMTSGNHQEHQKYITTHMGHIQSAFELIGMGLTTSEGWSDNADFLIVNNYIQGGGIKVISTASLMYDTLNAEKSQSGKIFVSTKNPFAFSSTTISVI